MTRSICPVVEEGHTEDRRNKGAREKEHRHCRDGDHGGAVSQGRTGDFPGRVGDLNVGFGDSDVGFVVDLGRKIEVQVDTDLSAGVVIANPAFPDGVSCYEILHRFVIRFLVPGGPTELFMDVQDKSEGFFIINKVFVQNMPTHAELMQLLEIFLHGLGRELRDAVVFMSRGFHATSLDRLLAIRK